MKITSFGIVPVHKVGGRYFFLVVHEAGGYWGFPKGRPKKGETGIQTALRELREETGIDKCDLFSDFEYIKNYSFNKKGAVLDKKVIFFLGLVNKNKKVVHGSDIRWAGWLSYKKAFKRLSHKEARKMLDFVLDFLKNGAAII